MHPWRECVAIEKTYSDYPVAKYRGRLREAAIVVNAIVSDEDRAAFHRVTCLGVRDPEYQRAVESVATQIRFEAGLADARELVEEFQLPLAVTGSRKFLAEISPLGLPIQLLDTSKLGRDDNVYVICVRVRHFPVPPVPRQIRGRQRKLLCVDCKEECWQDPEAAPVDRLVLPVCVPCARLRLLAERAGQAA